MLLLTIKKFTNLAERSQHLTGFRALSASQRFRAAQRFRVPRQQLERSRPIRTPYSPDGARGTPPPRAGARGHPTRGAREDTPRAGRATGAACIEVTRVYPGRGAPIFASARRHGAGEAARQRVLSRRRKEEWWDLERRDSHRQGQKRRRRDARAGSEAPKARCTGGVRSAE